STWAAFQGENYFVGDYISPFYSPEIFGDSLHSWFGPKPAWWPSWLLFSPALLVLWAPAGFRLSCYYYRCAFYNAFSSVPVAATSCRRIPGSIFQIPNMLSRLRVRDLFQSTPHALGVAEPFLGRFRRSLRAALCNGYLDRLADFVTRVIR